MKRSPVNPCRDTRGAALPVCHGSARRTRGSSPLPLLPRLLCATAHARTLSLSLLLILFQPLAHAQTDAAVRRALLDADLRTHDVVVLTIDDRQLIYADLAGRSRQSPLTDVVALLPPSSIELDAPPRSPARRRGVLTLVDGRRYPGEHAPADNAPDAVSWRHPVFGAITHALDDVAAIAFTPEGRDFITQRNPDALRDAVLLANGDVLDGFVVAVGANVEIDVDGQIVSVPAERVLAATIANPTRPPSGLLAWIDDGAVVRLTSINPDGGEWLAVTLAGGQSSRITLGAIRALVPDAARIQPLAALIPTEQSSLGERRTFAPVRAVAPADDAPSVLGAHDLELPGPMRITYELPHGATRFGAVAELPRDAWPWGDCVLVIEIDGREALRERLNMDRPRVEFSVPTSGRTLIITLDEGAHGPINDRVILRRPLLLVDQPAS